MDLRHLETFCSVVDAGGFTRAADRLYLTQPAVSLQIRQLEQSLGTMLFERSPKGVVPTSAGKVLYRYARDLIALAGEARAEISAIEAIKRKRIRVGTTDLCAALLAHALLEYCQRNSDVEVAVFEGGAQSLLERVRAGEADFALVSQPPETELVTVRPLLDLPLVFICRSDHPLALLSSVSAHDLAAHPLAVFEKGALSRQVVERTCSSVGRRPRIAFESNSLTSILRALEAGLGATLLPAVCVGEQLDGGTLVALPLDGPVSIIQVGIAVRPGQQLDGSAQELLDAICRDGVGYSDASADVDAAQAPGAPGKRPEQSR